MMIMISWFFFSLFVFFFVLVGFVIVVVFDFLGGMVCGLVGGIVGGGRMIVFNKRL